MPLIPVSHWFSSLRCQSPIEQQAFYQACISHDESLKQIYHAQYYPETLATLKKHVDYIVTELNELSLLSYKDYVKRHPRLPLLSRHNEFVWDFFDLVQENLDTLSA